MPLQWYLVCQLKNFALAVAKEKKWYQKKKKLKKRVTEEDKEELRRLTEELGAVSYTHLDVYKRQDLKVLFPRPPNIQSEGLTPTKIKDPLFMV